MSSVQESIVGHLKERGAMSEHALSGLMPSVHPNIVAGALSKLRLAGEVTRCDRGYFSIKVEGAAPALMPQSNADGLSLTIDDKEETVRTKRKYTKRVKAEAPAAPVEAPKKRGRPKKTDAASAVAGPKKRGRPKKKAVKTKAKGFSIAQTMAALRAKAARSVEHPTTAAKLEVGTYRLSLVDVDGQSHSFRMTPQGIRELQSALDWEKTDR